MERISRRHFLWLVLCLGLTLSGAAWASPALTNAHLPPDTYEGQATQLDLTFEWPAREGSYEIKGPQDVSLNNFKLLDVSQSQETYSSGTGSVSRLVLTYRIVPLKSGSGTVSSFDVLFRKPGAANWKTLTVPTVYVDIKPALPMKLILIFLAILAAITIPAALWFLKASRAEQKKEAVFLSDPRQQFYADTVAQLNSFITGYTASSLRMILSEWSSELLKVVMTCYDIPLRPATKNEILKELHARSLPAGELQEIEGLLNMLEHVKFSTDAMTSAELEKIRLSLLQYVKGKLIIGNL